MGNERTKMFICFFTKLMDVQFFRTQGVTFQIDAASFIKVCDCWYVFPFMTNSGLFDDF